MVCLGCAEGHYWLISKGTRDVLCIFPYHIHETYTTCLEVKLGVAYYTQSLLNRLERTYSILFLVWFAIIPRKLMDF